jgi:hypothetical protein
MGNTNMSPRKLPLTLAAAALACAALAAMFSFTDTARAAGKPKPPAVTNPVLVYTLQAGGNVPIYVMAKDGTTRQVTSPASREGDYCPAWSPDGRMIAFLRSPDNLHAVPCALYAINSDGTNQRLLSAATPYAFDGGLGLDWSPDGAFLMCTGGTAVNQTGVCVIDAQTGNNVQLAAFFGPALIDVHMGVSKARFGPDLDPDTPGFQGFIVCKGWWDSGTAGQRDGGIVVLSTDIQIINGTIQIAIDAAQAMIEPGANLPVLSPDGSTIAYLDDDHFLYFQAARLKVVGLGTDTAGAIVFGQPAVVCDWSTNIFRIGGLSTTGDICGTPAWSSDGSVIVFAGMSALAQGGIRLYDLFHIRPDGSGAAPLTSTTDSKGGRFPALNPAWDPNGP